MGKTKKTSMEKPKEEYLHGYKELSELLGVSVKTAIRMRDKIPHYRINRTIFFKKDEVLAVLRKEPQNA